jgi:hypothetical protein
MWLPVVFVCFGIARVLGKVSADALDDARHSRVLQDDAANKGKNLLQVPILEGCSTPVARPALTREERDKANEMLSKFHLAMSAEEVAFFSSFLLNSDTKVYFEYGMGGSTRLACHLGGDRLRIYAVDSSKEWVQRVNHTECIKAGAQQGRVSVRAVNIGPIGAWGMPNGTTWKHLWPRYSRAIASVREPVDLVLVDGRFRVACALTVFLRQPKAVVLLHDAERTAPEYSYPALCEVADRVAAGGRLVQMRLKPGVTSEQLRQLIHKFEFLTGR